MQERARRGPAFVAATGLLCGWLTSCGDSVPSGEPSAGPTSLVSTSPQPDTVEETAESGEGTTRRPKAEVRRALARWLDADTGTFTETLELNGIEWQTRDGSYTLSQRSTEVTMTQRGGTEGLPSLTIRGIGDVTYLTSPDWPHEFRGCWLRNDPASLSELTGMPTAPGAGGLPGNVVALSYAEGIEADPARPDVVLGTVDLPMATTLFGSWLLQVVDDWTLEAGVPAEFTLEDGLVREWRLAGADMRDALDREGLLDDLEDERQELLASFDVTVRYDDVGAAVPPVRVPAAKTIMSPEQMNSREGCTTSG